MNRCVAFLFALCCACLSVSSACIAAIPRLGAFHARAFAGERLHPRRLSQTRPTAASHDNWSSSFRTADLVGLDLAGFRASGNRPLRFALIREAGRLDCAGHGGESYAAGNCTVANDPAFLQLLAARGIGAPTREQAFSLISLDVRRVLIEAVAAAHYPTPTIDNLIEMTAVGVDAATSPISPGSVTARSTLHNLVEFRAMDITPEWIGAFARIGYANMPADELVQLKALDIDADYVAGFDRIGYGRIAPEDLVQLKALDISPDYVAGFSGSATAICRWTSWSSSKRSISRPDFAQWAVGQRSPLPPVNELVQMKISNPRHSASHRWLAQPGLF